MNKSIKSAGGIIYYKNENNEPFFLLVKRHALSKKIERVAPKGKVEKGENEKDTVKREIEEEVGLKKEYLKIEDNLGELQINLNNEDTGKLEKTVVYYLVKFIGKPEHVNVANVEGYIGHYKRANIKEVLGLIYYENLREIFRKAYHEIK